MTKSFVLGVSLATALACAATGAWAQTKPDKAAQTFVTKAVQGNLAEVSMGQLAQEKGDSDGVRSFGQQLVADHTAANKRAVSIASEMGMTPPASLPPSRRPKRRRWARCRERPSTGRSSGTCSPTTGRRSPLIGGRRK